MHCSSTFLVFDDTHDLSMHMKRHQKNPAVQALHSKELLITKVEIVLRWRKELRF